MRPLKTLGKIKVSGVPGRGKPARHVEILISCMNYRDLRKTVRKTSFLRVWQGSLFTQSSDAKGMLLLVFYMVGRHLRRLPLCDVQGLVQSLAPHLVSPVLCQKKNHPHFTCTYVHRPDRKPCYISHDFR